MNNIAHIEKLKTKRWKNTEISTQIGVTPERIRQIIKNTKEARKRISPEQLAKTYLESVSSNTSILLKEIVRLSSTGRESQHIVKKKILVKYLRGVLKLSYPTIAALLKHDHTTIIYLFNN